MGVQDVTQADSNPLIEAGHSRESTEDVGFRLFVHVVLDGVFSRNDAGEVRFHEAAQLTPEHWAELQYVLQRRVLRYFRRNRLLDEVDAHGMLSWQGSGGFSIDASVRIEGEDRAGVERLLRYCARPPFALERLGAPGGIVSLASPESRLVYRLPTKGGVPKPTPGARSECQTPGRRHPLR